VPAQRFDRENIGSKILNNMIFVEDWAGLARGRGTAEHT
jgi:hypothetical protein